MLRDRENTFHCVNIQNKEEKNQNKTKQKEKYKK
jgi:hypothetical protein